MNEFVSISKLMQGRKDKINSKDITKRFLFSLFDSPIMTQDGNMTQYEFYSLSLKVKWVYSLQYLFYHLLYMADMIPAL